jgi:effector-binding domain-containing protein
MKILKYIGIIALCLLLVGIILMFVVQTHVIVKRSITIDAPKELVKDQIVYFENSKVWFPWFAVDPNVKDWIEGEDGTVGAKYYWNGNEAFGEGSQEITAINDNRVEFNVNLIRPFQNSINSYFELEEKGSSVEVTWACTLTLSRPQNILRLFKDMGEEAMGNLYEYGLSNLKSHSEEKAKTPKWNIEEVNLTKRSYMAYRQVVSFTDMYQFYNTHLSAIYDYITNTKGMELDGSPSGIYFNLNDEQGTGDVAAAFPVKAENTMTKPEGYQFISISGKAYKISYFGNYAQIGNAHNAMHDYFEKNALPIANKVLEEYLTDPAQEPDTSKWLTNIYYIAN